MLYRPSDLSIAMTLALVSVLTLSCKDQREESSPNKPAIGTSKKDSKAKNDGDALADKIMPVLSGLTFYDGIYRVTLALGPIDCNGDFPVKIRIPKPEKGKNSPLDFNGAKMACAGISLPLDSFVASFFTDTTKEFDPKNIPKVSLKADNGVYALTQFQNTKFTPYFPIFIDIMGSDKTTLSKINVSLNPTISDENDNKESGSTAYKVNSIGTPFTPKGGPTLPNVTTWSMVNSGYEKKIIGPHCIDRLDMAFSFDPLALAYMQVKLKGLKVAQAAAKSFEGEINKAAGSLAGGALIGLANLLGDNVDSTIDDIDFRLDLVKFTNGDQSITESKR